MKKNVAELIVEMLIEAGVKRIYAVTGDSLNEINNAVRLSKGKIQWIHVRHEETGAYAAGAENQLTGELGCCAGSSGPGHIHLINGLYDCQRSGASVLAIASMIVSNEMGIGYIQDTNPALLFNDCSYYNQQALSSDQVPRMLQSAMQEAISKKGVAVFGIPGDVTLMERPDSHTSTITYPCNSTVCPDYSEIQTLANLLNGSKKVALFCGIGCAEAHDEIIELSFRLHAPVAYTFKGKMAVQYDNPNEVGLTGLLGLPSGFHCMHDAEVLVMLGTDFPYDVFLPAKNKIVQIDIRAERLGRRAKLEMGLCGDIKTTLTALLPLIKQQENDEFLKKQLEIYRHVKNDLKEIARHEGKHNNIQPEFAMSKIDEHADRDAIFTVDTGMTCVWAARYLNATGDRKLLGSFTHASMANALPQAIGAALAFPGRQVIALCGDGGISMGLGDLATVVQYKLPIKIIIFNNRALGMVKLEMEVAGLPDWETDMVNPNFELIAQGMGMKSMTISEPNEVAGKLAIGLQTDGPVLINVMTNPNALAMPPKITYEQMKGFVHSMYEMMMLGRTDEVMNTAFANFKHLKSFWKY